jgi:hypothetical protein
LIEGAVKICRQGHYLMYLMSGVEIAQLASSLTSRDEELKS